MTKIKNKRTFLRDYDAEIKDLASQKFSATQICDKLNMFCCASIRQYCSRNSIPLFKDSPGGHNFIDLSSRTYGQMKVLSKAGYAEKGRTVVLWNCICLCGKEFTSRGGDIRSNRVKTCGCQIKIDNPRSWKGYGEISGSFWRTIHENRKKRAREVAFEISIEFAWELFLKQNRLCALSGLELTFGASTQDRKNQTASLDRIDSKIGYLENNVQWVHKKINNMKQDMPEKDFIYFCKKIVSYNE